MQNIEEFKHEIGIETAHWQLWCWDRP